MDIRKGVLLSSTNLVEGKKEMSLPWKGVGVVVLLTLLAWASVFILNDLAKKKINAIQSQINNTKQGRDYQKIAYVADSESRLGSIRQIATERTDWEKIIQKIEENTLPEITYSAMDGRVVTQNSQTLALDGQSSGGTSWQLDLKGSTVGIDMLAKQVMAYGGSKSSQGEAFANDVSIQKIDIKKTESGEADSSGSIDFTLRVDLNPNIIKTSTNN
ncbi:MAG: hypothetical protein V1690_00075 [Candidatus Moraniibacteriota bacterium]